jgi:hypothetical protein
MKINIAIPILAAALFCTASVLSAAPAQAAASAQAGNAVQSLSPSAPPPPPGPTPPPGPGPTPPPGPGPAHPPFPPGPAPHPRPPTPADWPYYYGTPYPYYYNYSWPWIGTYRYYVRTTPVIVEPSYTYQYQDNTAPVVNSFTANPSYIQPGQSATLLWTVSNATNVLISPSVGSVANTGSFMVQPYYTTTYTLTATGSNGAVSASTTVTVAPVVTAYSTTTAVDQPVTTSSQNSGFDIFTGGLSGNGNSSTNLWLMYTLLIALLGVGAAVIIFLVTRKPALAHAGTRASYSASSTAVSDGAGLMHTTPAAAGHGAKLVGPGGEQIGLAGKPGALGRNDFQSLLKADKADLISRQHILLDYDNGRYYIEDKNSTNGTRLNGNAIKGAGKHMLKEGDTIELGNALTFTFRN